MFEGKLSELCKYNTLRWNLIIVMFCWGSTSMGFYMLAFLLKYLKGNIFLNAYTSSAGEILGKLSTIAMLKCISLKRVLLVAFCTSSVGMLLLILCDGDPVLTPWVLGLARIGFSQGFVAVYLTCVLCYPTVLTSTTIGIATCSSKILTMSAPLIAELDPPINLVILLVIAVSASIVS